jgi:hypothetical protein
VVDVRGTALLLLACVFTFRGSGGGSRIHIQKSGAPAQVFSSNNREVCLFSGVLLTEHCFCFANIAPLSFNRTMWRGRITKVNLLNQCLIRHDMCSNVILLQPRRFRG